MKIIALKIENFKKIIVIDITPKGNVIVFSGKNKAGKTSAIDSIWSTLQWKAGKKINKSPIRAGEKFADVTITFEDFIVNRKWLEGGHTYLKVTNREGLVYSSPQELLDKFIGVISFDISLFVTMTPKEQRDLFLKIAEVDIDYYDNKIAEVKERRLLKGREVRTLSGAREDITLDDLPKMPIDTSKLSDKYDEATELNNKINILNNRIVENDRDIEESKDKIKSLESCIKGASEANIKYNLFLTKNKTIDTAHIKDEIADAYAINKQIEASKRNFIADMKQQKAQKEYEKDTEELKSIEDNKSKALANSKMKIKGLSIDDLGVLYNGIPFTQISSSEQIKICMEIGIALKPEFKCIFLRNYTLLDADSKRVVDELSLKYGYQVICEQVVNKKKEGVGFYLEEGEIVDVKTEADNSN